jgi:DNA-binding transcriptional MerR regulator
MESSLTIKEVAQRTGLTAYTLRYYERIGLIAPIARAGGGQRRYASSDMDWLEFLKRLRATDMPIQGMQEFARLRSEGNGTVTERRTMLDSHLALVMAKIQALQQSAQVLKAKIAFYRQIDHSASQAKPLTKGNEHDTQPLRTRTRQTSRD